MAFNETVEIGLLLYNDVPILHMIDQNTRWHEARIFDAPIRSQGGDLLTEIIDDMWISKYGIMKELTIDAIGQLADQ